MHFYSVVPHFNVGNLKSESVNKIGKRAEKHLAVKILQRKKIRFGSKFLECVNTKKPKTHLGSLFTFADTNFKEQRIL